MQDIPLKCKDEQKNLYNRRLLNDVIYTVKKPIKVSCYPGILTNKRKWKSYLL